MLKRETEGSLRRNEKIKFKRKWIKRRIKVMENKTERKREREREGEGGEVYTPLIPTDGFGEVLAAFKNRYAGFGSASLKFHKLSHIFRHHFLFSRSLWERGHSLPFIPTMLFQRATEMHHIQQRNCKTNISTTLSSKTPMNKASAIFLRSLWAARGFAPSPTPMYITPPLLQCTPRASGRSTHHLPSLSFHFLLLLALAHVSIPRKRIFFGFFRLHFGGIHFPSARLSGLD